MIFWTSLFWSSPSSILLFLFLRRYYLQQYQQHLTQYREMEEDFKLNKGWRRSVLMLTTGNVTLGLRCASTFFMIIWYLVDSQALIFFCFFDDPYTWVPTYLYIYSFLHTYIFIYLYTYILEPVPWQLQLDRKKSVATEFTRLGKRLKDLWTLQNLCWNYEHLVKEWLVTLPYFTTKKMLLMLQWGNHLQSQVSSDQNRGSSSCI